MHLRHPFKMFQNFEQPSLAEVALVKSLTSIALIHFVEFILYGNPDTLLLFQ